MSDTVEFAGQEFRMAESIGLMPLMQFAHVAKSGVDSSDLDGLAAMYDLLEQSISSEQLRRDKDDKPTGPTEWERFQRAAVKSKADGEALMGVVKKVIAALSGRPTSRPSDSSDGPTTTPQNSEDASSLRVVKRLEDEGRPDLALMVTMAEEGRSAA